MGESKTDSRPVVSQVVEQYGRCLEMVPVDPHFHEITVGLYVKDERITVWTFSQKPKVDDRIRQIRDQLVVLGEFRPVEGTHNQLQPSCDMLHVRPIKFLLSLAVEKDPDFRLPTGPISIKDSKTDLFLTVEPREQEDGWVYEISSQGEAPNVPLRLKAIVMGFVRYGEMKAMGERTVGFACGSRHDGLARVLMPYSRNISAVADMLQSAAMRGQLTTGTAGFSPL